MPQSGLFPVFVKLEGRPCLVIGGGTVAETKIESLLAAGARVRVVAPRATRTINELAAWGRIERLARKFQPGDLAGQFLVIAATSDSEVNRAVFEEARERAILCNAVDDPPNCDFYFPAVVRRGDLQIAISTGGKSPALAQQLREQLEREFGPEASARLDELAKRRRDVLESLPPSEERNALLHELARDSGIAGLAAAGAKRGWVYIAGAGPGDPALLTVKARVLLQSADVVLHDDLVPGAVLALARPDAEVTSVGKRCGAKKITQAEINQRMIQAARNGRSVLRLKGGDPGIFGRLNQEARALEEAGVPFEIVPGVTASLAAAAAAGLSLTDRETAAGLVILSNHHAQRGPGDEGAHALPFPASESLIGGVLDTRNATLAIYMPGQQLSGLREQILACGIPADTPALLISRASLPTQEQQWTTVGELASAKPLDAPSVLLIGRALRPAPKARSRADLAAAAAPPRAMAQEPARG